MEAHRQTESGLGFAAFLDTLFARDLVTVGPDLLSAIPDTERAAAGRLLQEEYARTVLELPGTAPAFDLTTALEAARVFHNACVNLVNRALDAATVTPAVRFQGGPGADGAAAHLAADLVFHRLPNLWQMTRNAAPGDPLAIALQDLAAAWPLSAVGITDLPPCRPDVLTRLLAHPCLRILYADRVIQRRDRQRLQHPETRAAVQECLGGTTELWPDMEH